MLVVLDHRALEPPLPDVAPATMKPVITLRMGDQEALHYSAHRARDRTQQQMEVIFHQAVTVQLERLPLFQIAQRFRKAR